MDGQVRHLATCGISTFDGQAAAVRGGGCWGGVGYCKRGPPRIRHVGALQQSEDAWGDERARRKRKIAVGQGSASRAGRTLPTKCALQ